MKQIDRLIYDIHQYLNGEGASPHGDVSSRTEDAIITLSKNIAYHTLDLAKIRPIEAKDSSNTMVRMSELGEPCLRKMVYKRYHPHLGLPPHAEPGQPTLQVKFLLGDYVEEITLFLAEESGHTVSGRQKEVEIRPVGTPWYAVGHLDALIDGHVIDVKSASDFAFGKYKREGLTAENDGFGYRYQIDGYAAAMGTHNRGFLFVNKHDGAMHLVDRSNEPVIDVATRIRDIGSTMEAYVTRADAPPRLPTVLDKKLAEQKLGTVCSYCSFKHHCHKPDKDLQGYIIGGKPVYYVNLSDKGREALAEKIQIPSP